MHPRLIAANGRVAHSSLKGQVDAERFVDGNLMQVSTGVTDLLREPGGALDTQLLLGADFLVLEIDNIMYWMLIMVKVFYKAYDAAFVMKLFFVVVSFIFNNYSYSFV